MPLDALSSGTCRLGPDCSLCFWGYLMQLALLIYAAFRLLCGSGNEPCNAEPIKTAHVVEDHSYVTAKFPDDPAFAIVGSEMLSQYVIRADLTKEQESRLAMESPLYQQLAKVSEQRLRRLLHAGEPSHRQDRGGAGLQAHGWLHGHDDAGEVRQLLAA